MNTTMSSHKKRQNANNKHTKWHRTANEILQNCQLCWRMQFTLRSRSPRHTDTHTPNTIFSFNFNYPIQCVTIKCTIADRFNEDVFQQNAYKFAIEKWKNYEMAMRGALHKFSVNSNGGSGSSGITSTDFICRC